LFTSTQLRAARAILKWSLADLSEKSGIGTSTLKRLEAADGIPGGHLSTFTRLLEVFSEAGVQFVGTPEDGPGVRLRKVSS
jgi:transcriptional regulator with XRE-family HTH domain